MATLQVLNKPAVATPAAPESSCGASGLSGASSGHRRGAACHPHGGPAGRDGPADQGEALCLSARDTLVAREDKPGHGNGGWRAIVSPGEEIKAPRTGRGQRCQGHRQQRADAFPAVTPPSPGAASALPAEWAAPGTRPAPADGHAHLEQRLRPPDLVGGGVRVHRRLVGDMPLQEAGVVQAVGCEGHGRRPGSRHRVRWGQGTGSLHTTESWTRLRGETHTRLKSPTGPP